MKDGDHGLWIILTIAVVAIGLTLPSPLSGEGEDAGEEKKPAHNRFLERFDTNGDGLISDEEKEAAKERMRGRARRDHDGRRGHGGRHGHERIREGLLKRFDSDGDGVLSGEERARARESMRRRPGPGRGGPRYRIDSDGDGVISEAERAEARERWERGDRRRPYGEQRMLRERMNRHFDKDGDGEFSPEEREARDREMRKRRAEFVERFDEDGDGSLSEKERRAAAEERRNRSTEGAAQE